MLRLFDTLTGEVREIRAPGVVRMYSCGPTVYRRAHLGNLRSFLLPDLVRRVLEARGVQVRAVMNITDIGHLADEMSETGEDKVLAEARRRGVSPLELAEEFTRLFFEDTLALAILPAHRYPRASEHIFEMISLIQRLLERGHAYVAGGAVFYDVTTFPAYGKLSGNTLERLRPGHRKEEVDSRKRHHFDFVLWKDAGPRRILSWESPWGRGYPGWHIECSAMSLAHLGDEIELHTGGQDLIFPHHEDEIAQSEGVVGRQVVKHWAHGGHLLAEGRRMSKSAGNYYTLAEVMERGHDPLSFRLLSLTAKYRSPLNFTWDSLEQASHRLKHYRRQVAAWSQHPSPARGELVAAAYRRFLERLENDLDTPGALAELDTTAGSYDLSPSEKFQVFSLADRVLGLDLEREAREELPKEALALLAERNEARRARDYARADAIRARLLLMGIEVDDTPWGTIWRRRR